MLETLYLFSMKKQLHFLYSFVLAANVAMYLGGVLATDVIYLGTIHILRKKEFGIVLPFFAALAT